MPAKVSNNPLKRIWANNNSYRNLREKTLPVDSEACYYCIRHFYQNEYLNKLHQIYEAYKLFGVAEKIIDQTTIDNKPVWI
jgi:hypothetical protein